MREHYHFDTQEFTYKKVRKGVLYYLLAGLPYALMALGSAAVSVVLFYTLYDSPQTRTLKLQNNRLAAAALRNQAALDTMGKELGNLTARNRKLYRAILNADPIDSLEKEGAPPANALLEEQDLDALESRVDALNNRLEAQSETQDLLYDIAKMKKKELAFIPSIRPVPTEIISGYGMRRHPIFKRDRFHPGIDFKADPQTPVRATADGVVLSAGSYNNGLGVTIVLNHQNGYLTTYGHLSRTLVTNGRLVKRGTVIGYTGSSGLTKGPHLYYEIDKDGRPVNPIDFFFNDLKPEELVNFKRMAAQYNESMS